MRAGTVSPKATSEHFSAAKIHAGDFRVAEKVCSELSNNHENNHG
jgi:hypothetical protein